MKNSKTVRAFSEVVRITALCLKCYSPLYWVLFVCANAAFFVLPVVLHHQGRGWGMSIGIGALLWFPLAVAATKVGFRNLQRISAEHMITGGRR